MTTKDKYTYEYTSATGKKYKDEFYWGPHSKKWSRHRYSYEESKWFHDEYDGENFTKMRRTMYKCSELEPTKEESEAKKKKFYDGIGKRTEERISEELYYDAYYKRRLQDLKKFHRFNEDFLANDGYLDGYCEADEDWFYEMKHDKEFMNEYERRHGAYGWQDYVEPPKPKPYKPLDDPKVHQAMKELQQKQATQQAPIFGSNSQGESMCLSTKGVNKLNGLKVGEEKFVELTQSSSEAKTITVDLVSLLSGTEAFKALGLGKDALLKAVDLSGDSLSIKLSLGEVVREENAMMQAALIQLVNTTKV